MFKNIFDIHYNAFKIIFLGSIFNLAYPSCADNSLTNKELISPSNQSPIQRKQGKLENHRPSNLIHPDDCQHYRPLKP
jgi:hypothetical protein